MTDHLGELKQLWLQVLDTALRDYTEGPAGKELQDYIMTCKKDAEHWLESDSREPGSFIWVCDMFGMEHTDVRRRAREKREVCNAGK